MKLEIKTEAPVNWDDFLLKNQGEFLLSSYWGRFKERLGNKVYFLSVVENQEKIAQALILKQILPLRKSYLYCPRGPVFLPSLTKEKKEEVLKEILKEFKNKFFKGALFFRFEPEFNLKDLDLEAIFSDLKFDFRLITPAQPEETLIIDLTKEEGGLFQDMHYKTRYNIHLAEKHGVEIKTEESLKIFLELLKETAKRAKLKFYGDRYYFYLSEEFKKTNSLKIYSAFYQNKILATALVLFWGKTAVYLYGGSTREEHQVMAPYLLHWQIMKEAKSNGFFFYDFWGIDEKKWPGLTRFKLGFGGQRKKYPPAFDLIFNKFWYFLYKFGRKIKRSLD